MSFRDPGYLWLLTLLVIPLILYLLPLPRRQIISSALFLWERFLESERFGNTTERFRRALGLALIFAILISLILGAADPINFGDAGNLSGAENGRGQLTIGRGHDHGDAGNASDLGGHGIHQH